jgi:hypothetical protein
MAKMQIMKKKKGKAQTRQNREIKIIIIKHYECHCENTSNVGHKVKDYCCKNIKSVIIKTQIFLRKRIIVAKTPKTSL